MRFLFFVLLLLCTIDAKEQVKVLQDVINTQDLKDQKAKSAIEEWTNEAFGLQPYRPNYLLPFGYTPQTYKRYTATDRDYIHFEAEFQVSFKLPLAQNIFGYNGIYYGAYTQRSYWQVYTPSSPFRETNYNPEAFAVFPVSYADSFGLKTITVGYSHISNGQGNIDKTDNIDYYNFGNRSRSINTLFTKFTFQQQALIWHLKFWLPIGSLEDNPDIMHYYGYGSIGAMYFYRKNLFTIDGRFNPFYQKGAVEATYSRPSLINKNVFLFVKVFYGFGESLIDYNHEVAKIAVGWSFSR